MEVADAADHGRAGDHLIALHGLGRQQFSILAVAVHKLVFRMVIVRLGDRAVLGEIIDANDVMTARQKFIDKITTQKAGRAGDKNPHC